MKNRLTLLCLALLGLTGGPSARAQYTTKEAFPGLSFPVPVEMVGPDDQTNRVFVASQSGTIRVVNPGLANASAKVFLDLTGRLLYGGERGLLGLAFHPDYARNGYFYLNYNRKGPNDETQTVISRWKASAPDPDAADPNSEVILLTFDHPDQNHKGGKIAFGNDGYLYIASGDGGGGGDPLNNAQNRTLLLGKILRIDVNQAANGLSYAIPPGNPYAGNTQGFRPEIYAYGLRNPWKMSVDRETGNVWAGDVGQEAREEIDLIQKGGNYGWRLMEGKACYNPVSCDPAGLVLPVWDYAQDNGRSITGGFVYRGKNLPGLRGKYIYGDFISGHVWALTYVPGGVSTNEFLFNFGWASLASFGEDANRELYLLNFSTGKIGQLVDPTTPVVQSFSPRGGTAGTTVVITGANFSAVPAQNAVRFGEATATVTAATTTSLTVVVPAGLGAGPALVTAAVSNRTSGSDNTFAVTLPGQTIQFAALPGRTFGEAPFVLRATASSSLPVSLALVAGPATLSGDTVKLTGAGTVAVRASQAGNANYQPAPDVTQSFTVNKAAQTISFPAIADKLVTDAPFALSASASSNLPVTLAVEGGPARLGEGAGSTPLLTPTGAGPVTVRASQAGNANYLAAPDVAQTFRVQSVTGTEEPTTAGFRAYPNPTRETFTVRLTGWAPHPNASLALYNAMGQKVTGQTVSLRGTTTQAVVSVNGFARGFYLLRVTAGNRMMQQKVGVE
ncbi:MAG: PQQ-dependent sugar dehydrogenase [Ferruginibacter sp.]|nr:PQQ-dependent sugar dehydrogenase [Cytophagales bacterium]